ncbi:MAG: DciA family protein [Planctomycetota bacterium]
MDEIERLQNTLYCRRRRKRYGALDLGQVAQQLMDRQITPRQAVFSDVVEAWSRMLPAELSRHCEIVDISGGLLKVRVDSPSYLYELQLCSSELLEELQQHCPKARLTAVKFVVA